MAVVPRTGISTQSFTNMIGNIGSQLILPTDARVGDLGIVNYVYQGSQPTLSVPEWWTRVFTAYSKGTSGAAPCAQSVWVKTLAQSDLDLGSAAGGGLNFSTTGTGYAGASVAVYGTDDEDTPLITGMSAAQSWTNGVDVVWGATTVDHPVTPAATPGGGAELLVSCVASTEYASYGNYSYVGHDGTSGLTSRHFEEPRRPPGVGYYTGCASNICDRSVADVAGREIGSGNPVRSYLQNGNFGGASVYTFQLADPRRMPAGYGAGYGMTRGRTLL